MSVDDPSVAFDDQGNFIGETTITQPLDDVPTDGGNTADGSGGFDWGGFDAFINSIDRQAAGWYVLTKQQNPTARTVPPALGGPPVLPPGTVTIGPGLGGAGVGLTIPPIVWIAGAVVLFVVVLKA